MVFMSIENIKKKFLSCLLLINIQKIDLKRLTLLYKKRDILNLKNSCQIKVDFLSRIVYNIEKTLLALKNVYILNIK